jgi:patatin-like phospholipase/acyl hydrolase
MFRVLCLSGGGLRGIFQSELLAGLHRNYGPFWNGFDLIIGTSTGSLIAAGLHQGVDPDRISEHYRRLGPLIFPQSLSWNLDHTKNALIAAVNLRTSGAVFRHTSIRLRKLLERVLGAETKFRDKKSNADLAVTATDLANGKVRVFSPITWSHDQDMRIVDTLIASTAAPGLLPCCEIEDFVSDGAGGVSKQKRCYVDGGIWAFSPILPAVVLAHSNLGIPFNEMRILSIGAGCKYSGFDVSDYQSIRLQSSALCLKLFNMAISAAADASDSGARQLVGDENFLHIEPAMEPGREIGLFDYVRSNEILPRMAAQSANSAVIKNFLARCELWQLTY